MNVITFLKKHKLSKSKVLEYLKTCIESREVSSLGSKEVFIGKAAFGIFGGGKELPQIALAHHFKNGDFRSGYYRDQTFMFSIGAMNAQQLFAQLYAHPDIEHEIVSAGRLMTGHFGTPLLNKDGTWRDLTKQKNSSVDISPTAAQMPRSLGLAAASKLYRNNKNLHEFKTFSNKGNEVSWVSIGNASTSEGMFFETVNAAGVMQVPLVICVWDDDYGISVHNDLQTTKGNISKALAGFQKEDNSNGLEVINARGWNFMELIDAFSEAEQFARKNHTPVLLHINELTQPQGHSTSGSHERYKSEDRLNWEKEFDCIKKFVEWIIDEKLATIDEVQDIIRTSKQETKDAKNRAYKAYVGAIIDDSKDFEKLALKLANSSEHKSFVLDRVQWFKDQDYPLRSSLVKSARQILRKTRGETLPDRQILADWIIDLKEEYHQRYSSSLYNSSADSVLNVKEILPEYSSDSKEYDGFEILQHYFDAAFTKNPLIYSMGEDVGRIGDVNQGMAGLQEKFGVNRITDTGIRECTIVGEAIGAALRGLRPIAEIQYLDYILYAIQIISDDLATLHYRSAGQQKCPMIVRTRGHRLQGVWHSGSPLGTILNALRGVHICVPRNMVQAAGMYNSLLQSGDPGLVIETLNAYRKKERLPNNLDELTVPLGQVEVLKEGSDMTIVTYGAMCQICLDASAMLSRVGIDAEVIDVQTLIPFDRTNRILESIKKTNRVLIADEDVPGGATAYMLQKIVEKEGAYNYLDSKPRTIHSWAHRPAYATDGDYFSKPNADDVFDWVYEMLREAQPDKFPAMY